MATFGNFWTKLGYYLVPTSGHTASHLPTCFELWFFLVDDEKIENFVD